MPHELCWHRRWWGDEREASRTDGPTGIPICFGSAGSDQKLTGTCRGAGVERDEEVALLLRFCWILFRFCFLLEGERCLLLFGVWRIGRFEDGTVRSLWGNDRWFGSTPGHAQGGQKNDEGEVFQQYVNPHGGLIDTRAQTNKRHGW